MSEAQHDTSDQAPEHSQPAPRATATGERSLAAGRDINAPIFLGDIRNSVINIYNSALLLPRAILVAVLLLVAVTLGGVALLVVESGTLVAAPRPPDLDRLEAVGSLDPRLAISALALDDTSDPAELWIGAQSGTRYALYRLDATQQADGTPQHMLDVDEEIIGLAVDCKGNVWLLLNNVGVLVYQPRTGRHSTLLNRETTNNWLIMYTTFAIATRCVGDTVEIWLGREGVHTLRYSSDYPSMESIEFVPWEDDTVFQESQSLSSVRALHYATDSETLWALNSRGQLLFISFKGVRRPEITDEGHILWSLSQSPDGAIWAGGSQHLIRIGDENQIIALVKEDGAAMSSRAFVLAAGQRWVWFGDRCTASYADCWPLGVYAQGSLFPIDLGERKEVRDIVIGPSSAVWIGTEAGLILYSDSE